MFEQEAVRRRHSPDKEKQMRRRRIIIIDIKPFQVVWTILLGRDKKETMLLSISVKF